MIKVNDDTKKLFKQYLINLKTCGIKLNPGMSHSQTPLPNFATLSEAHRYRSIMLELDSIDPVTKKRCCNQTINLDFETVGFREAYVHIINEFTNISRGTLKFDHLKDQITDDGALEVLFEHIDVAYRWEIIQDGDWLDGRIINWLAFILDRTQTELHYYFLDLDGAQNVLFGCFTNQEIDSLRALTTLDWQRVEPIDPGDAVLPAKAKPKSRLRKTRGKKSKPKAKPDFQESWRKGCDDSKYIRFAKWLMRKDIFENWSMKNAHNSAQYRFERGLEILFMNVKQLDFRVYMRQTLRLIERTHKSRARKLDDFQVAIISRATCYASVLLGKPFDSELLDIASTKFEESFEGEHWDDYTQMYYLAAIRAALIAGNVERANELLDTKKKFKYNARESALLRLLCDAIRSNSSKKLERLMKRFRSFFDMIRKPFYFPKGFVEHPLISFEYGVLWNKYFCSKDGTIDWFKAADAVTEAYLG